MNLRLRTAAAQTRTIKARWATWRLKVKGAGWLERKDRRSILQLLANGAKSLDRGFQSVQRGSNSGPGGRLSPRAEADRGCCARGSGPTLEAHVAADRERSRGSLVRVGKGLVRAVT